MNKTFGLMELLAAFPTEAARSAVENPADAGRDTTEFRISDTGLRKARIFARPALEALLQISHAVFPQNAGSGLVRLRHVRERRSHKNVRRRGHHFTHQALPGRIKSDRGYRLQQTARRSRDRIPKRRDLSLSRRIAISLRSAQAGTVEGTVL